MSKPPAQSPGSIVWIRTGRFSSCQSEEAIAAGAFHNDVVAVANENVLLAHELAFEDRADFYTSLRRLLPDVHILEVPAAAVSLEDAIRSYLFNAQLVTLPEGGMGLILPEEARETPSVWDWLKDMVAGTGRSGSFSSSTSGSRWRTEADRPA
jgi:succinylarginine dihydrolase